MRKEEILAQSRAEGKDEMEIVVNHRSSTWRLRTFTIIGFFLMIIKLRY